MVKLMGRDNLLVMGALLVWALGEGLWYFVRQIYLTQLGATPVQVGTALAIEIVGRAVTLLPAGYGIDRIGPRQMLIGAWVAGIVGTVAMGIAVTWQTFMLGLFAYGLSGFAIPAVSAYALATTSARRTNARDTQQVLAFMFAVYPLGLIISPTVGGWIGGQWGIGTCLWVALAAYFVSLVILLPIRHVEPHPHDGKLNIVPMFSNRTYLWRASFFALCISSMYVGVALLPNYLKEVKTIPLEAIGVLYSIQSAGTVAVNLLVGRLAPRWTLPAVVGLFTAALALIWLVPGLLAVGLALFTSGAIFVARTVATGSIEHTVNAKDRGMAFSMMEMIFALMTSLAGQTAGLLYAASPEHTLPFVAAIILAPLMLVAWFATSIWQPGQQPALETPATAVAE